MEKTDRNTLWKAHRKRKRHRQRVGRQGLTNNKFKLKFGNLEDRGGVLVRYPLKIKMKPLNEIVKKGNIRRVRDVMSILISREFEQLIFNLRPGVIITQIDPPSKTYEENIVALTIILNILTGREICYFRLPFSNINMILFADNDWMDKALQEMHNALSTVDGKQYKLIFHRMFGKFCGYPTCCINQYIEDLNTDTPHNLSEPSARRYLNQIGRRRTDPFDVIITTEGNVCEIHSLLGFIPCSPECKKALKLRTTYLETPAMNDGVQ